MKIKSIAPWFGGKRSMAPDIVAQLGEHSQYFEPFCGSMAVLFGKAPSVQETVNDLHGDLINLAKVLQDKASCVDLYERLQRTLFCEVLLEEAERFLAAERHEWTVERAYWYFLACWMARNGVAGTAATDYQLAVRWTGGGGSPTIRFRSCVESVPAWHARLQNVVILNRNAFDILPRFDDADCVAIYADPPYLFETRGVGANGGRHGTYLYEFQDDIVQDDHARLRDELCRFRQARVVVSSYDCKRIRDLYAGWTFLDKTRRKNLHSQNGRGGRLKAAPEVLIINGPAYPQV